MGTHFFLSMYSTHSGHKRSWSLLEDEQDQYDESTEQSHYGAIKRPLPPGVLPQLAQPTQMDPQHDSKCDHAYGQSPQSLGGFESMNTLPSSTHVHGGQNLSPATPTPRIVVVDHDTAADNSPNITAADFHDKFCSGSEVSFTEYSGRSDGIPYSFERSDPDG